MTGWVEFWPEDHAMVVFDWYAMHPDGEILNKVEAENALAGILEVEATSCCGLYSCITNELVRYLNEY